MPLTPIAEAIVAGNRRALAKAITLVESSRSQDRETAQALLNELLPHTGKSLRVGITGVPGVGKSTFIESFGQHVIAKGHKVAVLAVDPSSPMAGGSILALVSPEVFVVSEDRPLWMMGLAGLLVGFGTQMGSGCTSGHGVCGITRLSLRSLVATGIFMVAGMSISTILAAGLL